MPTNENSESELPRYSNLLGRLEADLSTLGELHRGRDEVASQLQALAHTRDRLNRSVLDAEAPQATLLENLRELEGEKLLLQASLDALSPRIDASEVALQNALAPAGARFGRLRDYMLAQALSRAVGRIAALLEPAWRGRPEVTALAEHELEYVQAASLALPSTSGWATARPLNEAPVAWNSLTRPFTKEEIALARAQTIDAIKTCATSLVKNGRKIIKECEAFGPEGVPQFDWTEPVRESKSVADLSWNEPLGSTSDASFIAEVCRTAGKDPATLSEPEKAIVTQLAAQKRTNPVSHASFAPGSPMIGSTINPAETPGFDK